VDAAAEHPSTSPGPGCRAYPRAVAGQAGLTAAVSVLLAVVVGGVSLLSPMAYDDLDSSWVLGLTWWFQHKTNGSAVYFTYGPLGWLTETMGWARPEAVAALLFMFAVTAALACLPLLHLPSSRAHALATGLAGPVAGWLVRPRRPGQARCRGDGVGLRCRILRGDHRGRAAGPPADAAAVVAEGLGLLHYRIPTATLDDGLLVRLPPAHLRCWQGRPAW
jgi:hypothetical protein